MAARRGEIGRIFVQSYRDANRLVRALWLAIIAAAVIAFVAGFAADLASGFVRTDIGKGFTNLLVSIGTIWIAAPYAVAQYRFLLRDEVETWPERLRGDDGVRRYFAWSAVLAFLAVPVALLNRLPPPDVQPPPLGQLSLLALCGLGLLVFVIRTITLLPAAALGERLTIREALSQTRGRFWFILIATLLPVATTVIPALIISAVLGTAGASPVLTTIVDFAGAAAASVLSLSAISLVYRSLVLGAD